MKDDKRIIDRRDFVVGTTSMAIVAGAGLGGCDDGDPTLDSGTDAGKDGAADLAGDAAGDGSSGCTQTPKPLPPVTGTARVVEVHDPKSLTASTYDDARITAMLLAGIKELGGDTDIKKAWKALIPDFSPSMRIGLKVNYLSSRLYNYKGLLEALVETLVSDLGADAAKIWIWDRRTDELTRSNLPATIKDAKVAGTVATITDPTGPGYEAKGECIIDKETRLSQILTQQTDITINLPVLKTHNISAMTGALKNSYGVIHNPGEFHTNLNQYLPAIYRMDRVHKSFRLHITEALKAVIKGDTTDYPDTIPARLILSKDPVAMDAHAIALINALRAANTPKALPALSAAKTLWLTEAEKLNLGTTKLDLKKISMP